MGLSTHILDTALGKPAAGVALVLSREASDGWHEVGGGSTDADGRCRTLLGADALQPATYKLRFETAPYFAAQNVSGLYPHVEIVFIVTDPSQHYHIPLLLTANGYTTYRGS
jgi:5-hydroxyisourate hydrolase